jgi:phosphotransferase system HPr (HPr) family protein
MSELKAVRTVVVGNSQGLHARPADLFVRVAIRFPCEIEVIKGSQQVNGKSILDIMTLGAEQGTSLSLEAIGPDAEAALDALAALFAKNFAEEDTSAGA